MKERRIRGRLSREERSILFDAAQFVLAGEWPWETPDDEADDRRRWLLQRAAEKLWRSSDGTMSFPWSLVDLKRLADVLLASKMTLGQLLDEMREAAKETEKKRDSAEAGNG